MPATYRFFFIVGFMSKDAQAEAPVRKHALSRQVSVDGSIDTSYGLNDAMPESASSFVRKMTEAQISANGRIELSKDLIDSTRKLSPKVARSWKKLERTDSEEARGEPDTVTDSRPEGIVSELRHEPETMREQTPLASAKGRDLAERTSTISTIQHKTSLLCIQGHLENDEEPDSAVCNNPDASFAQLLKWELQSDGSANDNIHRIKSTNTDECLTRGTGGEKKLLLQSCNNRYAKWIIELGQKQLGTKNEYTITSTEKTSSRKWQCLTRSGNKKTSVSYFRTVDCDNADESQRWFVNGLDVEVLTGRSGKTYKMTGFEAASCPQGSHEIFSTRACELAAIDLEDYGFRFMGSAEFTSHAPGCAVDDENKVMHNSVTQSVGLVKSDERLICETSKTCSTYKCPAGTYHNSNIALQNPTNDNECCDPKPTGMNCLIRQQCLQDAGLNASIPENNTFMCNCIMNVKGVKSDECSEYYACLHERPLRMRSWFGDLLKFQNAMRITLQRSDVSLAQAASQNTCDSSSNCVCPETVDFVNMDCTCLEHVHDVCPSPTDREQCLKDNLCSSDQVCPGWRNENCSPNSSQSLIEKRSRGAADQEYTKLDESVGRKCR